MHKDYCNKCFTRIKNNLDFKICKKCNEYYCYDCGNNTIKYIERTNLLNKYLLNSCFACHSEQHNPIFNTQNNLDERNYINKYIENIILEDTENKLEIPPCNIKLQNNFIFPKNSLFSSGNSYNIVNDTIILSDDDSFSLDESLDLSESLELSETDSFSFDELSDYSSDFESDTSSDTSSDYSSDFESDSMSLSDEEDSSFNCMSSLDESISLEDSSSEDSDIVIIKNYTDLTNKYKIKSIEEKIENEVEEEIKKIEDIQNIDTIDDINDIYDKFTEANNKLKELTEMLDSLDNLNEENYNKLSIDFNNEIILEEEIEEEIEEVDIDLSYPLFSEYNFNDTYILEYVLHHIKKTKQDIINDITNDSL